MAIRNISFEIDEYYHLCNRGVDKRIIFNEEYDTERFLQSMEELNTSDPIGSIYEYSFTKKAQLGSRTPKFPASSKLVEFVAFCLNPNHYHFIVTPLMEKGIEKFMQKLGTGYTNYFNNKYKRSGALFQGRFKAVHIGSNEQLLHVSAYVNLNNRTHQLGSPASKLVESKSSWREYVGESEDHFCNKDIILGQFKNVSEYKKFAESSLQSILDRKEGLRLLEEFE